MPVKVPSEYWAVPEGNSTSSTPVNPIIPQNQKKAAAPPPPSDVFGANPYNEQLSESFIAAISGFNFLELGGEAPGFEQKRPSNSLSSAWGTDFLSDRSTSAESGVTNSPTSETNSLTPQMNTEHYAAAERVWGSMPQQTPTGYPKPMQKESAGSDHLSNRQGEPPRTTLMIRNIPRKYSQRQLLTDLNEAYAFTHGVDFFYLPTDLGTGRNLGYCFVNFLRPADAEAVKQTLHKFRLFNAAKSGLSIGYADVQGFEQNLRNVRRSLMHRIKNREYRPLVAGPDGDLVPVTN